MAGRIDPFDDRQLANLRVRQALLASAIGSAGVMFVVFIFYERLGLGIGHGFYLPVILAAAATGPLGGILAGVGATVLYAIGIVVNPHIPPSDLLTASTAVRLVMFVAVGSLVGYLAQMNRQLLTGANELIAELTMLSRIDFITGLPNHRAFERAITARLNLHDPSFSSLASRTRCQGQQSPLQPTSRWTWRTAYNVHFRPTQTSRG
jgi:hypothetical protein